MKRLLGLLALAALAVAQASTIGAGARISVRTNENIDAAQIDGRVFTGVVNQDVRDANGNVVIPKGSNAELIVKKAANEDLLLELESVTANGQRYAVTADMSRLSGGQWDGIGRNKRTARFVGGGAAMGAIVGAITGRAVGAVLGAVAGAGAGGGTQILTREKTVTVPAESLLTFRLEQPLETRAADSGSTRYGRHYQTGRR
jgi:hypothetical protein